MAWHHFLFIFRPPVLMDAKRTAMVAVQDKQGVTLNQCNPLFFKLGDGTLQNVTQKGRAR